MPTPIDTWPKCKSAWAHQMDPEKNQVLKYEGAEQRIRKAALDALFGRPLWPAQALFVLLKYLTLESKLGDSVEKLHQIVCTLCYASQLNKAFAEMTDR